MQNLDRAIQFDLRIINYLKQIKNAKLKLKYSYYKVLVLNKLLYNINNFILKILIRQFQVRFISILNSL